MFEGRLLVVAFEGWNDATESATTALNSIAEQLDCETLAAVDPEDYFDFQFTRPMLELDESGQQQLVWPSVELMRPGSKARSDSPRLNDFFILSGAEPSRRWLSFTGEIMDQIMDREVQSVIFLGSMLADVPHTRPTPIYRSSANDAVRSALGLEPSRYEGPVGIMSVLAAALEGEGIPHLMIWASVPHYVHQTACPKASLALLAELEKVTGLGFETAELATAAFEWERNVDEIAAGDEELAGYITQLERTRDAAESERLTGEELAKEFERYLNQNPNPDESTPRGDAPS
jgi:hypothetical protein